MAQKAFIFAASKAQKEDMFASQHRVQRRQYFHDVELFLRGGVKSRDLQMRRPRIRHDGHKARGFTAIVPWQGVAAVAAQQPGKAGAGDCSVLFNELTGKMEVSQQNTRIVGASRRRVWAKSHLVSKRPTFHSPRPENGKSPAPRLPSLTASHETGCFGSQRKKTSTELFCYLYPKACTAFMLSITFKRPRHEKIATILALLHRIDRTASGFFWCLMLLEMQTVQSGTPLAKQGQRSRMSVAYKPDESGRSLMEAALRILISNWRKLRRTGDTAKSIRVPTSSHSSAQRLFQVHHKLESISEE
ncbi:hypothetical protein C8F04DRAFT_1176023 [Mycena alexandri]|uniref:Uncharacterized protein n=1 Tax=Mycena alexandri TaxID=1745969 RepID=A0AAD6TBL2_9AGAR|nr:hypothetical protein C8F04DRAFT_1176023 [Mycena alexandri]